MKLTKQKVRDLNDIGPKKSKIEKGIIPKNCDHKRMREHCFGCGHWECPDCDFGWDAWAQK